MTNKRVLVIDDDLHFAKVLCRSLERNGYTSWHAENAEQALSQASEHKPDWITLDLRLEQDSGLQLIEPLIQRLPDVRIVMLTGYASIPTAVEAVKLGAHNYLHKPATLQELVNAFSDNPQTQEVEQAPEVMSVDRMEWEHIQRVLNENNGNISATARALNMHRRTLQRKLQKYAPR
ncbi:response regulator transcription factor [Bacterioplanoides sp.]|uniref:response regulator transcription factor n=1 Tax=Bacterioplanoides sp. TaxID=2066072 RepID=UPI003B5940E0